MIYKINILAQADKDLAWFRKNDRKSYIKCFDLVRDVAKDAQKGIGKPERLKYFDKQVYSRRVNRKDRMVYIIYEETKTIDISSFRGHYE